MDSDWSRTPNTNATYWSPICSLLTQTEFLMFSSLLPDSLAAKSGACKHSNRTPGRYDYPLGMNSSVLIDLPNLLAFILVWVSLTLSLISIWNRFEVCVPLIQIIFWTTTAIFINKSWTKSIKTFRWELIVGRSY